jgi:hypothetical protein
VTGLGVAGQVADAFGGQVSGQGEERDRDEPDGHGVAI